jgi:hypothetical protein
VTNNVKCLTNRPAVHTSVMKKPAALIVAETQALSV